MTTPIELVIQTFRQRMAILGMPEETEITECVLYSTGEWKAKIQLIMEDRTKQWLFSVSDNCPWYTNVKVTELEDL